MNNINTTGYTIGSNTENNHFNIIPSNIISMQNVDKQLTLIPIINGKPDHSRRVIANPGDADINFGEDVTGVMEIPYAQSQWGYIGGNPYGNNGGAFAGINPTPPIDNSIAGYGYNMPTVNTPPSQAPFIPQSAPPISNQGVSDARVNQWNSQVNAFELGNNMQVSTDPNLRQQMEVQEIQERETQRKGQPFQGALNPYGGFNLNNTASFLGTSIEQGNALGIVGSAGKLALGLGREIFTGMGATRRYNESLEDYRDADAKARQRQDEYYSYQSGGEVTKKYEDILKNAKIINTEFDKDTNEYIITYN